MVTLRQLYYIVSYHKTMNQWDKAHAIWNCSQHHVPASNWQQLRLDQVVAPGCRKLSYNYNIPSCTEVVLQTSCSLKLLRITSSQASCKKFWDLMPQIDKMASPIGIHTSCKNTLKGHSHLPNISHYLMCCFVLFFSNKYERCLFITSWTDNSLFKPIHH